MLKSQIQNNILVAAKDIKSADAILINAGAGIGVDSGLPDFRGNQGFWKVHPNYAAEGLSFADLANPRWFETHPIRAWGFYGYRYRHYCETLPHEGFHILKRWQNQAKKPGSVMTSNVDGHFQKAGFAADRIHECHGSIHFLQCTNYCRRKIWKLQNIEFQIDPVNLVASGQMPLCPECGNIARPNILMFGDYYWLSIRSELQRNCLKQWQSSAYNSKIVTIEIGAGTSVGSIRNCSENMPGKLIRINPREADGRAGTISIEMTALAALKAIDEVLTCL